MAAFALEVGDALGFLQRFLQLFGQLQAGEQVGAQRQQRIAQRLKRLAFALEVGLAGVRGAFELGLEFEVQVAAFGNEAAFHVIAFFGFA